MRGISNRYPRRRVIARSQDAWAVMDELECGHVVSVGHDRERDVTRLHKWRSCAACWWELPEEERIRRATTPGRHRRKVGA